MSSIFDKVQPAVKKETRKVAMITAVGLVLMWILFAGLHFANAGQSAVGLYP